MIFLNIVPLILSCYFNSMHFAEPSISVSPAVITIEEKLTRASEAVDEMRKALRTNNGI